MSPSSPTVILFLEVAGTRRGTEQCRRESPTEWRKAADVAVDVCVRVCVLPGKKKKILQEKEVKEQQEKAERCSRQQLSPVDTSWQIPLKHVFTSRPQK